MKVFIDTNVLFDVLAKREPFFADSAAIWTLAETGKVEGLVSAVSFTNIFY
jgi:predicted nucleic acid-binding protein